MATASFKKDVKDQGSLVHIHHDPDSEPSTMQGEDKVRKKKKR